jgi:hypothetical protein
VLTPHLTPPPQATIKERHQFKKQLKARDRELAAMQEGQATGAELAADDSKVSCTAWTADPSQALMQ